MKESTSDSNHTFFGDGVVQQLKYKEWWAVARQSEDPPAPYDLLVNLGIDPERVNNMLTREMKEHGSRPGMIDFYAHHHAKRNKEGDAKGDIQLLQLLCAEETGFGFGFQADRYQPTRAIERDLLSLADATDPSNWSSVLGSCLGRTFSGEFLHSMCSKVPVEAARELFLSNFHTRSGTKIIPLSAREGFRKALDEDCMRGIRTVLPRVKSLALVVEEWKKPAFLQCLRMMMQTTSLEGLELGVPSQVVMDTDQEEDADESQSCFRHLFRENRVVCGIQKLKLRFFQRNIDSEGRQRDGTAACLESYPLTLACLFLMPHLQALEIKLGNVPPSFATEEHTCIVHAMDGPNLQHLSLAGMTHDALVAVLKALQTNSSLVSFKYVREGRGDEAGFQWQLYEELLLEALQEHNTTLTKVTLGRKHPESSQSRRGKILYFLDLNKYGRSAARDPRTTRKDFVALLSAVGEQVADDFSFDNAVVTQPTFTQPTFTSVFGAPPPVDDERDWSIKGDESCPLRNFNTLYGLLRELPDSWSVNISLHLASPSRTPKGGI